VRNFKFFNYFLAFPSDTFFQEPWENQEIKKFVSNYKVQFPMFDKVSVNGYYSAPLFEFVKGKLPSTILGVKAEAITWNFTKVKKKLFLTLKVFI
jgi:glutathione peroxidase